MFIRKRNDRQITFSSNNEREMKRVEEKLKVIERPCCADIYYCGTAELFVRRALSFQLFFQVDVLRQKRAPIDESDDSCEKKLKLKYLFVQKKNLTAKNRGNSSNNNTHNIQCNKIRNISARCSMNLTYLTVEIAIDIVAQKNC